MKTKTNKQKKLEGTDRPDRKRSFKGIDKIPEPSEKLPKDADPYYYKIAKHLLDNNALQDVDSLIIERAARCLWELEDAEEKLDDEGRVSKNDKGVPYLSPYFTAVSNLNTRFAKYCELLGMSPKSRYSMGDVFTAEPEPPADPFSELLGGSTTVTGKQAEA